jgi:N-acetylglucosaminyldiphosphoundecaprenol N-acetyl-beta-D-mannosaminyltransferase
VRERISGSDLLPILARIASERGWKLVLLGNDEASNRGAADALKRANPSLVTVSLPNAFIERSGAGWSLPDSVAETLSMIGPCMVFVGLGMRKQEEWMNEHLRAFPDVKMAIGCGGAFAMIAGTLPRAPAWMRRFGLEWLWRLWLEPKRIGRIIRAVIVFPIRAIVYEIFKKS